MRCVASLSRSRSSRKGSLLRVELGVAVVLAACAVARPARASGGTWTIAPVNPTTGGGAFGLWLLTDGTVLSHGNALNHWVILTPDKTGSYINGTWKSVANSTLARSGATQHVLKDGRFFQAGGEFINGPACTAANCSTAEIYDPVANTWTNTPNGLFDIGDTGSATLSDGTLLYSTRAGTQTEIYDPVANMWTQGASMPRAMGSGDENAWASLQNGGVLAVDQFAASIYDPATATWQATGPVPTGFNTGDTAGIAQMFDGRVLAYGISSQGKPPVVYIYTPGPTAASPGTWAIGPAMVNGDEAEDEYTDVLTDGTVMVGLTAVSLGPGVGLQLFDPTTNTVASTPAPPDKGNPPFPIDYVNLPTGQTMVTSADNDWILTPTDPPNDAWRPTVTSVVFNSGTTYTLTGTQLSGLINGADEGDDMTMAQNYPIVWLKDGSGNVFFCKTFNFSNMMPSAGSTVETTQFTTPAGLASGTYDLFVSAVGVQSKNPLAFTTGVGGTSDGGTGSSSSSGAADAGNDATTGSGGADAGEADASSGGSSGARSGSSSGGTGPGTTSSSAAGNSSGAGSNGASSGGGAGSGDTSGENGNPKGCGCTTVGSRSNAGAGVSLLGLAGLIFAAGRRRRRAKNGA